ncbi:MAG TPA: acVLRF1 family peptidyl-tRNA hydrolase [Micromonosporaceae bacterium]|nr:acVLRF1 family peptidyl-tRNA hydrolase [Micromonosporaceae bacterium]
MGVPPERLAKWISGFGERHGGVVGVATDQGALVLTGDDGAVAFLLVPPGAPVAAEADVDAFVQLTGAYRRIGLLLARKAAVGIGVAVGPDLTVSKVDSHYVQSRTAAGGWSQQRFARRRDNQAKAAAESAADLAVRLLLPAAGTLDALVTGGDRRTVETILADRRLAPLVPLVADRFLDVPEPRHAVLEAAVAQAREIRIRLLDPA